MLAEGARQSGDLAHASDHDVGVEQLCGRATPRSADKRESLLRAQVLEPWIARSNGDGCVKCVLRSWLRLPEYLQQDLVWQKAAAAGPSIPQRVRLLLRTRIRQQT